MSPIEIFLFVSLIIVGIAAIVVAVIIGKNNIKNKLKSTTNIILSPINNNMETKNGYQFLKELCSFQADFNAFIPRNNPLTNRVVYIMYQLSQLKIQYTLEMFNSKGYDVPYNENNISATKYVNVVVKFKAPEINTHAKQSVIFLAHHDIANPKSENCNDNTASIANLLHLCQKLNNVKNTLQNDVYVVFTDAEEIVSSSRCGSGFLAKQIKENVFGNVLYCVNLELTAYGTEIWMDNNNAKSPLINKLMYEIPDILPVHTPFNDSNVLRDKGIDSVCLGTLPLAEVINTRYGYYPTWSVCHREIDKFENANKQDMENFVEKLMLLI